MRRALGSLLLTFSLMFATVSWSGFILTRTIFDPGRSERLADEVLDNEAVRAVIVNRLADTINSSVPAESSISDEQLQAAAEVVLEDPTVEMLLKEQIVLAHQNALNGVDEPVQVDTTPLGEAARAAAIQQQPTLANVLPEVPSVEVTLPTTGLSWLGTVNTYVQQITFFSGLVAVSGIALSLFITSNRSKVLRRVSYWAFGAAAFWVVAAFVAPWVVNFLSPSSLVLVTAAINVFFGAMIPPAIAMAVFGAVLYGVSLFLPRLSKQRAAGRVQSSRPPRTMPAQPGNGYASAGLQTNRPVEQNPNRDYGHQGSPFDNQRLQREVDASRTANQAPFDSHSQHPNAAQRPSAAQQPGPAQRPSAAQRPSPAPAERRRIEDDWFGSPSDQSTPGQQSGAPSLWDDDPTFRQ